MILMVNYGNDTVWTAGMRAARNMNQSEINKNIDTEPGEDIGKSGTVNSSQTGVHPRLELTLRRHLQTPWAQPLHTPTVDAYHRLVDENVFSGEHPIILDSGCGTGKSTQRLADLFPQHIVIGIDRSLVRLAKSGVDSGFNRRGNCILLRAELATFWRLMASDGHSPEMNFLLYPNPYPKPGHLKRRWHGHPVFPHLLSLGGEIELRCNWKIYALEFAQAIELACDILVKVQNFQTETAVSPFERKYLGRGQQLYSVSVPASATQDFRLHWHEAQS